LVSNVGATIARDKLVQIEFTVLFQVIEDLLGRPIASSCVYRKPLTMDEKRAKIEVPVLAHAIRLTPKAS
jgi:hypothetical protein